MNGFPGTVAQVWQQAGRAGRSNDASVAVLVGRDDPLDQYYVTHPEFLLNKPFEMALVDTQNPNILAVAPGVRRMGEADHSRGRVRRSSASRPLPRRSRWQEPVCWRLRKTKGVGRYHYRGDTEPGDLDLRSMGATYSIVEMETGALLGTVDGGKAFSQIHPGAVYLHQGENWEVEQLDLANHVALVEPVKGQFFTQSRETSDIRVLETLERKRVGRAEFYLGRVEVTNRVVAFARQRHRIGGDHGGGGFGSAGDEAVDGGGLVHGRRPGGPEGRACPPPIFPGSLHAAEHAAIGMLPLFAMADRWDIGGVSTAFSADTNLPTVFIYDGYPGGRGDRRPRVRRGGRAPVGHPGGGFPVPVRAGVPVVHPVAQMRQRQRTAGQSGGNSPAGNYSWKRWKLKQSPSKPLPRAN